jgi:tetratricopeptide (TPR) repeat protein
VNIAVSNLLAQAVRQLNGGDEAAAESHLTQALALNPEQPVAHFLMGTVQFQRRRWKTAEQLFRQALARRTLEGGEASEAIRSEQAMLHHYLGQCLKAQRRYAEALGHLDGAKRLAPRNDEIDRNRAVVLQHLRRFDDAIAVYEHILANAPLDMDTHLHLNELLYRQGRDERFLSSYEVAARRAPHSALPLNAKGHFLLKAGLPREAHEAFQKSLKLAPDCAATLTGLAHSLEALGDRVGALDCHKRSVLLQPEDPDAMVACAGFLLRGGAPQQARELAARAQAERPTDQGALAMLGLCCRALKDVSESVLNDYASFVRVFDLDPPEGYASMESFNCELSRYLDGLHADTRENFTQTLRGGTRLYDELFYNGHELVDRLTERIEAAVEHYIASLRADSTHPFTSRRGDAFSYSGSWSSRICGAGYHVNHIHPAGWISSAYYVAVPDVAADRVIQQGWLKFGEPTADFGSAFPPRLVVQPKPGRLVLFPSYLWHGTVPYRSPQNRTTIAFDVVPRSHRPR